MTEKETALQIPQVENNTIKLFVNDEFVGDLTAEQVNKFRVNVVKYIHKTQDISILNDFYFVGHRDSNDVMENETIKIFMDIDGNLTDFPWEMSHARRDLWTLLRLEREKNGDDEYL